MPENLARILGVEVEEVELGAETSVVATLRLLGAGDDLVKLGLVLRDNAVDALEHLVLLVATVVAASDARKLHDADLLRMLDMGAAAHLDIVAHRVGRDRDAVRDDVRKALKLVLLTGEELLRLVRRHFLPDERLVEGDEARNLGFDLREILGRKAVRKVEVVVEALVRRRADVDLDVLEQIHDRAGHQVRRAVPALLQCNLCHILLFPSLKLCIIPKNAAVGGMWCTWRDSNPHAFAVEPKSTVSAIPPQVLNQSL